MNAPFRKPNALITAAHAEGADSRKSVTRQLLKALSENEGDSDLGRLAHAILHGGDFYMRSYTEDYEASLSNVDDLEAAAARLAEEYRLDAECQLEGAA